MATRDEGANNERASKSELSCLQHNSRFVVDKQGKETANSAISVAHTNSTMLFIAGKKWQWETANNGAKQQERSGWHRNESIKIAIGARVSFHETIISPQIELMGIPGMLISGDGRIMLSDSFSDSPPIEEFLVLHSMRSSYGIVCYIFLILLWWVYCRESPIIGCLMDTATS